ncbi:hypothetical protein GCM10022377_10000 [Zhihengliuella alba]|uniref:Uncharacterized protein n=2 Tax=Zhihengliuella alba TaxID=547018 RepID=A0ABP7D4D6_9MICC
MSQSTVTLSPSIKCPDWAERQEIITETEAWFLRDLGDFRSEFTTSGDDGWLNAGITAQAVLNEVRDEEGVARLVIVRLSGFPDVDETDDGDWSVNLDQSADSLRALGRWLVAKADEAETLVAINADRYTEAAA